jgi:hypothetical protein
MGRGGRSLARFRGDGIMRQQPHRRPRRRTVRSARLRPASQGLLDEARGGSQLTAAHQPQGVLHRVTARIRIAHLRLLSMMRHSPAQSRATHAAMQHHYTSRRGSRVATISIQPAHRRHRVGRTSPPMVGVPTSCGAFGNNAAKTVRARQFPTQPPQRNTQPAMAQRKVQLRDRLMNNRARKAGSVKNRDQ